MNLNNPLRWFWWFLVAAAMITLCVFDLVLRVSHEVATSSDLTTQDLDWSLTSTGFWTLPNRSQPSLFCVGVSTFRSHRNHTWVYIVFLVWVNFGQGGFAYWRTWARYFLRSCGPCSNSWLRHFFPVEACWSGLQDSLQEFAKRGFSLTWAVCSGRMVGIQARSRCFMWWP